MTDVDFPRRLSLTHPFQSMGYSRRRFLRGSVAMAGVTTLSAHRPLWTSPLWALPPSEDPSVPFSGDIDPRTIIQRAIDSARSAGAEYVEARVSHQRTRTFTGKDYLTDAETLAVSVRVLSNGSWGFAASPLWSNDEAIRLGREATAQARTASADQLPEWTLAPAPAPIDGVWTMPVDTDPFSVPLSEIFDFRESLALFVKRIRGARVTGQTSTFVRTDKVFGSSEGSYCSQRSYLSSGLLKYSVTRNNNTLEAVLDCLTPVGLGWELYRGQPLREALEAAIEETVFDLSLPVKSVEVGKFNTVLDAQSVANILNSTIGDATELDRALGYEANAGGTSYISDPSKMLGEYRIGSPILTVTGNRSEPGGAATVRWDDEGIAPTDIALITQGVLQDMATNRDGAEALRERYLALKRPVVSHGCAYAASAVHFPLTFAPNLAMTTGHDSLGFGDLIRQTGAKVAIKGLSCTMDFQQASGLAMGTMYEVKGGLRVARYAGSGILFRTPELWKSLSVIGGAESQRRFGWAAYKGEPPQSGYRSVTAVPAAFNELTVIDVERKA